MGRREAGQAAVETALTLPMFLFTFLGILQISVAYHARILTEYATFKAARAGSVYRADCSRMQKAAIMALLPAMSYGGKLGSTDLKGLLKSTWDFAKDGTQEHEAPVVWIDSKLENVDDDFDKQLAPGADVPRIRVRLAYFFQYRIPFANYVMVRSWLATQVGVDWTDSGRDATMLVKKVDKPPHRPAGDAELVDEAKRWALGHRMFIVPIVTSWSMRMMSDPLPGANPNGEDWECRRP